jgi:hypothetical protein
MEGQGGGGLGQQGGNHIGDVEADLALALMAVAILIIRTFAHSTFACGSMVLCPYCMSFFGAGRG